MAHEVLMELNEKVVLHKDIKIEVRKDKVKLGTVLVSKGNIEWLPANNSVNKHRLTWAKFAELMEDHGKNAKAK
jgi:hypothetical protein